MQFALMYAQNTFDLRGKVMGRQSAGLGFLRAAVNARPERIWCYAASRKHAEMFGQDVAHLTPRSIEIRYIPWDQPSRLDRAGLLYRPDPGIADDAWRRRSSGNDRAFSICGVTHTLASHAAMTAIATLVQAPLYPWDALICTSSAARDVIKNILECQMEHFRDRFNTSKFTLPRLPLIPLGVHVKDFSFTPTEVADARRSYGCSPDEVVILFAGRLSFHGKAHPLPMFIALQQAAIETRKKLRLVLFGQFQNESIRDVFIGEASRFMPNVSVSVLDGAIESNKNNAWASADIFVSLSDNIQETFGLTPLEAMASGLPVIVSDWNGYRDTVRDGIDGFCVPSLIPEPGMASDLANRYDLSIDDYDAYIGRTSQLTSVSIEGTCQAFIQLVNSLDLRVKMGNSGRRRAEENFDWSVIFKRYQDLWDDLAEDRRSHTHIIGEGKATIRADRMEPFGLFRSYSTNILHLQSKIRKTEWLREEEAMEIRGLKSIVFAETTIPSLSTIQNILKNLHGEEVVTLESLRMRLNEADHANIIRWVAWLLKFGIVKLCS